MPMFPHNVPVGAAAAAASRMNRAENVESFIVILRWNLDITEKVNVGAISTVVIAHLAQQSWNLYVVASRPRSPGMFA